MTTFAAPSGNGSVAPTTPGVLYSRDNQGTGAVAAIDANGVFYVPRIKSEFDPNRLMVDVRGNRNFMMVYQPIPGKAGQYLQYRWSKVTAGTAVNLWKLNDITVVSRARTQWRFAHVAQLVTGGENDVVWTESKDGANLSIDDGGTVSGSSGVGDAFFGGSGHGNNKPITLNRYGTNLSPKVIVDGYDLDSTYTVKAEGRRVEILQKEELYRPRNPASTTAVITQMRKWTITPEGYRFDLHIKFNQQFTGTGYLPLICTQTRYTQMYRDSDDVNLTVPDDIITLAANAVSSGVQKMILRSADYGGVTINYLPCKQWAAGARPNGALRVPGYDYHQIRIVGGYHKLDRIIGGAGVGTGSNPYVAAVNEEWETGYTMNFNF